MIIYIFTYTAVGLSGRVNRGPQHSASVISVTMVVVTSRCRGQQQRFLLPSVDNTYCYLWLPWATTGSFHTVEIIISSHEAFALLCQLQYIGQSIPWSNVVSKYRNSSDPVVLKGRAVGFVPAFTFACGINNLFALEKKPKG